MYTGGMRIYRPKIFRCAVGGDQYVYALAGNYGVGKMAIQKCHDAITDLKDEKRNLTSIRDSLAWAVNWVNTEYVDTRPESERDGARFDLLIATWTSDTRTAELFATRGAAFVQEEEYQCIGTGQYLGHYLIRQVFRSSMSIRKVTLLAIQALAAAKEFDEYCGGVSQLIVLRPDGSVSPVADYEVSRSERHLNDYELHARQLLFDIADFEMDDNAFDSKLLAFIEAAKHVRASWRGRGFDSLLEMLGKLQPTPEKPFQSIRRVVRRSSRHDR